MNRTAAKWLVIALVAFATSWALAATLPRRTPADFVRQLVKPIVLPKLWRDVTSAERTGELDVSVAAARELMRFVPQWTDGHAHFAGRLAFDHGSTLASPAERCDALLDALAWLDDVRADAPAVARARLAATQATFVEARCAFDPPLAILLAERTGRDPARLAMEYLDAAIAARPDSVPLQERRAVALVDVVAAEIRAGDVRRAADLLDAAIGMLRRVRDPEASIPWVAALERIRPALRGGEVDLDSLRGDPYLDAIVRALESR